MAVCVARVLALFPLLFVASIEGLTIQLEEHFRKTQVSSIPNRLVFVYNGRPTSLVAQFATLPYRFDTSYTSVIMEWNRLANETVEYTLELSSGDESIMRTPVANIPLTGCVPSTNWTSFASTLPCVGDGTVVMEANMTYTIRQYNTSVSDVPINSTQCLAPADTSSEVFYYKHDFVLLLIRKDCKRQATASPSSSNDWLIPVVISVIVAVALLILITIVFCHYRHRMELTALERKFTSTSRMAYDQDSRYVGTVESYGNQSVLSGEPLQALMEEMSAVWKPEFGSFVLERPTVCVGEEIGRGAFGQVCMGSVMVEGPAVQKQCAVKVLRSIRSQQDIEEFLEEAAILKDFDHPNVIGLIGVTLDSEGPLVCLEFMHNGDLRTYLRNYRRSQENVLETVPIKSDQLLNFCMQIANGMAYLTSKEFIHRDLAARNCLLNSSLVVKIGDFGLARDIQEGNYYRMGTARPMPVKWMALESIEDQIFTSQTDVWAFGIVMWEVFSMGSTPYPGVANHEMLDVLKSGIRPNLPDGCPNSLCPVMASCWSNVPSERPSFKHLAHMLESAFTGFYENVDVHNTAQPNYENFNPQQRQFMQRQESTVSKTIIVENYENMHPSGQTSPNDELSINPAYTAVEPTINTDSLRLSGCSALPAVDGSEAKTGKDFHETDL